MSMKSAVLKIHNGQCLFCITVLFNLTDQMVSTFLNPRCTSALEKDWILISTSKPLHVVLA